MKRHIAIVALAVCGYGPGPRAHAQPPMGWSAWSHFRVATAQNVEDNASALVSSGLAAKGYRFVNLDGSWMSSERDAAGNLQADPAKFPLGMLPVAQGVHALGLKFGVFTDAGPTTCAGWPGSGGPPSDPYEYYAQDTAQFDSWGFDYIKFDACSVSTVGQNGSDAYQNAFAAEYKELQSLGRPVVFSESAPAYFNNIPTWYEVLSWVGQYGQLWRTGTDMPPFDPANPNVSRWPNVLWNYFYNQPLGRFQKPGNFDDPDFIVAGTELTIPESRTQFALWSMMSAPLILGVDLTEITPDALAIVGNSQVIAVDQDPLGRMATLIERNANMDVLVKPLQDGYAVAVLNRGDSPLSVSISTTALGFPAQCLFTLQDLWSGVEAPSVNTIDAQLEAHDTGIWKLTPSAPCGARTQTGAILMTVPSQQRVFDNYAQCLSSLGEVEVCTADASEAWTLRTGGQIVDHEGQCLDDAGGNPMQTSCAAGLTQLWTYTEAGNLINSSDGLCLSAAVVNGLPTTLEMQPCGYNAFNQIWSLPNYYGIPATNTAAALTSPVPNGVFSGYPVKFTWGSVIGATDYSIRLGTAVGGYDLYASGKFGGNSATVSNLPTNGETIHARLYTYFGASAVYNDYAFTAATSAGTWVQTGCSPCHPETGGPALRKQVGSTITVGAR